MNLRRLFISCILFSLPFQLIAEDKQETPKTTESEEPKPTEKVVETTNSVKVNGTPLRYKALTGNALIKNEKGNPKASIFYVAYIKDDVKDASQRPVTFCFNGGPGSSSVWLHMGAFGPKIVQFQDLGYPKPPYHLEDNPFTLLDITDLVFIDPVSTGYSEAVPVQDSKNFHGVDEDIKSVAEFIRLWTTQNNRWTSPKFVAGESYGTTRAAGLANYLHNNLYLYLNGVVLVSNILDFQAYNFDSANDLPYITFLPTYTATAWYHKKLSEDLQEDLFKTLKEVQEFAINEYSIALYKGVSLSAEERASVIEKLSRYTGISKEFIDKSNLRLSEARFTKELLEKNNLVVGRFDSRYKGFPVDSGRSSCDTDPSGEVIMGCFTGAFNYYLRNDLNWVSDKEYQIIKSVWPWDYGSAKNEYIHMSEDLRENMIKNPNLKIFVANGLYDLATPFSASIYTVNHLNLNPEIQSNITMQYYQAGHMMYLHRPSLVKLKNDLTQFIKSAL